MMNRVNDQESSETIVCSRWSNVIIYCAQCPVFKKGTNSWKSKSQNRYKSKGRLQTLGCSQLSWIVPLGPESLPEAIQMIQRISQDCIGLSCFVKNLAALGYTTFLNKQIFCIWHSICSLCLPSCGRLKNPPYVLGLILGKAWELNAS